MKRPIYDSGGHIPHRAQPPREGQHYGTTQNVRSDFVDQSSQGMSEVTHRAFPHNPYQGHPNDPRNGQPQQYYQPPQQQPGQYYQPSQQSQQYYDPQRHNQRIDEGRSQYDLTQAEYDENLRRADFILKKNAGRDKLTPGEMVVVAQYTNNPADLHYDTYVEWGHDEEEDVIDDYVTYDLKWAIRRQGTNLANNVEEYIQAMYDLGSKYNDPVEEVMIVKTDEQGRQNLLGIVDAEDFKHRPHMYFKKVNEDLGEPYTQYWKINQGELYLNQFNEHSEELCRFNLYGVRSSESNQEEFARVERFTPED